MIKKKIALLIFIAVIIAGVSVYALQKSPAEALATDKVEKAENLAKKDNSQVLGHKDCDKAECSFSSECESAKKSSAYDKSKCQLQRKKAGNYDCPYSKGKRKSGSKI